MTSIGLIGAGAVGQAVGTLLTASHWCSTVMVASGTGRTASGLVTDLDDMRQVTGSLVRVRHATLTEMTACDAVVVCPRAMFTNTARTDIRMAGLAANAPLITRLARKFTGYRGMVIMVTNPVDVMSRLFATVSGCDTVLGVGSNTDSARYRLTLARHLGTPASSVQGHVIGEHGEHAVICASSTTVNGQSVQVPIEEIRAELSQRPARISTGIGRTRSGPAGATMSALTHVLGITDGVSELSAPWRGVWLGIPLHFTAGHPTVSMPSLNPSEAARLQAAETKVRTAFDHITQETRIR